MIEIKIKEILKELSSQNIEGTDMTLAIDLGLDSLQMITLLILIEETFQIELTESDMDPFALVTVQDVISLVEKYIIPVVEGEENE